MKILAFAIALLAIFLALTGLFWPEGLLKIGHYSFTPTGLYVVAIIRVAIGLVFFLAASASRAPRALRVIGVAVCVAGVAAALFTTAQAQTLLNWWSAHGPGFIRVAAFVVLTLGGFIAYATAPRRP
jgi:hypothetical protein